MKLMASIPIQFFQVGAAAIPTLLVAVSVGLKQGAQYAELATKSGPIVRYATALLSLFLMLNIVAGELCALYALTIGSGDTALARPVATAIMICLLIIALEFLKPIMDTLPGVAKTVYFVAVILLLAASTLLFWYTLSS
jgi:hypothetical protein